jgi:hypothetical protein
MFCQYLGQKISETERNNYAQQPAQLIAQPRN